MDAPRFSVGFGNRDAAPFCKSDQDGTAGDDVIFLCVRLEKTSINIGRAVGSGQSQTIGAARSGSAQCAQDVDSPSRTQADLAARISDVFSNN